jgi:NADPH-dependent ferric siderophore reductase
MTTVNAHADVEGLSFAAMRQMVLFEAAEHALPILQDFSDCVEIESEFGRFSIAERDTGVRISLAAATETDLHVVREGIVEHLAHYLPDIANGLTWSDSLEGTQYPPNFQFSEVVNSERLNSDFHRLSLKLSKPDLFDNRALHFRFLIPHTTTHNPTWPTMGRNGAVQWPQGEEALHRPVYTVRHLDPARGIATVDIYNHSGGRAFEWAQGLQGGDEVALIGPGGGGVLDVETLVICGDEAAYPAIARILEHLPNVRGEVLLLNRSGSQAFDFNVPVGMHLTWLRPKENHTLANSAVEALARHPGTYIWFAADNLQADAFRKMPSVKNHPKQQRMIAAYWTDINQKV